MCRTARGGGRGGMHTCIRACDYRECECMWRTAAGGGGVEGACIHAYVRACVRLSFGRGTGVGGQESFEMTSQP